MFWILALLLAAGVSAIVLRPLMHDAKDPNTETAPSDVAFYKAQLEEVERDVARGLIASDEAERVSAEIGRRLIAADARQAGQTTANARPRIAVATGLLAVVASALVYLELGAPNEPDQPLAARLAAADAMRAARPDQAEMEAAAPAPTPVDAPADYLASVQELRDVLQDRPDDARGWELLAFHENELRNYGAAWRAQAQVIAIKGDAAEPIDLQRQLDLMVLSADGFVSPEAETIAEDILRTDPRNVAARYHLGALYAQTDRADLAFALWRPIVEVTPDSYHRALARAQIVDAAARAGVPYELPAERGPSMADIAAAEDMAPEDRAQMIEGMVASLSDRLATQGGGASDWAMLIRALGVLGDTEQAGAIWSEAQAVFAEAPSALEQVREAARAAGVTE